LASRKTVLVLHTTAQIPVAGVAWQALHYVLGLRRLGYDVWYIEDSGAKPFDPRTRRIGSDCSYNVGFLQHMMERFDLGDRWSYFDSIENRHHGLPRERVAALYREADALINLCGATHLREEHMRCPVRIFVDTDPGYSQVRVAGGDTDELTYLCAHTHLFTYGENLGQADCPIPATLEWHPTRPPVLIDLWDAGAVAAGPFFTSVGTWEKHGREIKVGDATYLWSKRVSFLQFLDLPRQTLQPFRLAIAEPSKDLEARVKEGGWEIVDPVPLSADMPPYREFIVASRGEFTVAKDIYVGARTGWFSDRSVCYLAAGRPVITQETGFSKFVPTGSGLFPFSSLDEVRDAIARINADYQAECMAAREVAWEAFDADKVLREMMKRAGI
jgi:hypothetical protein